MTVKMYAIHIVPTTRVMRRPNLALKRMNGFGLSKWRRSRVFVARRAFARRPRVSYVLIEIRHTGILTRLGWSMNVSCRLHAEHIVVMQRVERCDEGSSNRAVTALCDDDDMDFSLKLATAVLARTPDALSALLSGLGEEWTRPTKDATRGRRFKFWDT